MCGLVGVVGKIAKKENAAFRDLLMVDVIRGPHSTGIAAQPRNSAPKLFKKALLPQDLFQMKPCENLFNDYGFHKILMGHNRWATVGGVNSANAHPFEMETLIGAHNGTLRQQSLLPDHTQFKVDSENIFHAFETIGVQDTVKKLNGAYALTWFEKNDDCMHFLRNNDRTLFYCFAADDKTLFYASESWMLEGVLARNGIEHNGVIAFEPGWHYQLPIPAKDTEAFDKFYMTGVTEYQPPKYQSRWKESQKKLPSAENSGAGTTSPSSMRKATVTNLHTNQNSGTKTTTGAGEVSDLKKQSTPSGDTKGGSRDYYKSGDLVAFRVPANTSTTPNADDRSVHGRDVYNISVTYRIFLPRGSVVRKEMLKDAEEWWAGVVNGSDKAGNYIIQGNSVKLYDDLTDDEFELLNEACYSREKAIQAEANEAVAEKLKQQAEAAARMAEEDNLEVYPEDQEWNRHVDFIAKVGQCGWCNETLNPTEDNLIVNSQAVFCPHCKSLDDLQQFFP